VIELRNKAVSATAENDKIDCANKLLSGIKSVIAIAENYPELKSKSLYKKLMTELVDIEDRIVASRRIYDSNVNLYNTHIETFPNNIICKCFGFEREELFRIETGEKIVPNMAVDLNEE
jgi:LemA protein